MHDAEDSGHDHDRLAATGHPPGETSPIRTVGFGEFLRELSPLSVSRVKIPDADKRFDVPQNIFPVS
jgi:hypothetical protein